MSTLDDIVNVTISRDTISVARASFGTPGIISTFADDKLGGTFGRAKIYGSLTEMATAGWLITDEVYKIAQAIFSQNPKVAKLMVGRLDSLDDSVSAGLTQISLASGDWYAFTLIGSEADQKEAAEWAETQKKILFVQSDDDDILDDQEEGDLATFLKSKGYDRTVLLYHGGTDKAAGAWMGECLPHNPGSQTWAYKTLKGVTADRLTTGERNGAFSKNANIYTEVAGVSVTEKGRTAGGEWIDIIRGLDWVQSRLQEEVFGNLVNRRKIPYDDGGITLIVNIVNGVLQEAVRLGIFQEGTVDVTAPAYADIAQGDKTERNLPDVKFTALLQGAIHSTKIDGTVSV